MRNGLSLLLRDALEPERFNYLCEQVAARLPLLAAEQTLELMGAATRLQEVPSPVDRTIARLATLLDIDLSERRVRPFDWELDS